MNELVRLEVRLDGAAADDDPERLDEFTRELLLELREHDVESASLVPGGPAPPGTKGAVELAMAIALGVTTNAFWDLAKVLLARLRTRQDAIIRIDGNIDGAQLKFEGTPAQFAQLLETLSHRPPPGPASNA